MSENTVNVDCTACDGTGLYRGLWEKPNEAVVCVKCGGTGMMKLVYREFTGRKTRPGVERIRKGSGLIIDDAPKHEWFSYEEFEKRYPASPRRHAEKVGLSAEEWQLYDPHTHTSQNVAAKLNNKFNEMISKGATRSETEQEMNAVMLEAHQVGAYDSEVHVVLTTLLNKAFANE